MAGITVGDITSCLSQFAPPVFQEGYDNAGLITGSPTDTVSGVLVSLDCTEDVVREAISGGCNMVVAHHPIIFKGLRRLTGGNYVERTIILAIRHNIAIYAIHTNLDNVLAGVNRRICDKIGLSNLKILAPRTDTLLKLVTFVPSAHKGAVLDALHQAGAGQIGNYKNCSFSVTGTGTFMPNEAADPHVGVANQQEWVDEERLEVILPLDRQQAVLKALKGAHPYEEVAFYLSTLVNENQEVGSGMIGELKTPAEPIDFIMSLKQRMELTMVRHTALLKRPIKKVAVCGGAGSFLLPRAIQAGADVFVSADFKYHEFFDADDKIIVADIGHYESEAFTKDLIVEVLTKKFPTFAINFSKTVTNPISYS
ncbi:MAG: Nif3-like dinuclear metal center hexameric protein [Bacteroidia bacterium]|nr:Nif3-like dinuclear metal center hexameric protein [Bacteroidia bacterium]